MINLLYTYYRPLFLVLLVLFGLACGHLVDSLLQIQLRPTAATGEFAPPTAARSVQGITEAELNQILRHNIFDADNRSATATMSPAAEDTTAERTAASVPRADLKLIGTVVAGDDSLALLEANREMQVYRLDEEVPGGGRIEAIDRIEVTIRNRDQSVSRLTLRENGPGRAAASSRAAAGGSTAVGAIREVGENRWVVSQNLVESVRNNFSSQLRLAQMQPRLVDGQTEGFLVQRLYPQSILAKMGLQKGDVVIFVNDIMLDSPEKALQVFQQLRDARRLTVGVERGGSPMNFTYEIE